MQSPANRAYRADIDGIRAIAVVLVVLYHAFPKLVRNGFVGVDVFFVISGFLITSIIYAAVGEGNFSFSEFYVRRINRLFPALLLVLTSSLIAGWFVLFPDEYKQLGKHTASGVAFISNLVLWSESGYFDTAASSKVLLHLWSLGVEEQFYLAWPVLILLAWRAKFNIGTVCAFLLGFSFYLNIHTTNVSQVAAFYSPLTRFWELLVGALLAIFTSEQYSWLLNLKRRISRAFKVVLWEPGSREDRPGLHNMASILGLACLVVVLVRMSPTAHFPGRWAILPVVGTALLLAAGPQTWIARALLSNRVVVWIGLISYPLYLWHLPLLVFARYFNDELSALVSCCVVLSSFVLAWLTYLYVEKPIRFGARRGRSAMIMLVLMACVGMFGLYDALHDGFRFRMKDKNEYALYFEGYLYDASQFVQERQDISQNQCNRYNYLQGWGDNRPRPSISADCYEQKTKKSVLLWGDSHAAHLYFGLKKTLPQDISTLLIFSSGCAPHLQVDTDHQLDYCETSNNSALKLVEKQPPDVVMLASNVVVEIKDMRDLAHRLKQLGVKKVLVLGPLPHWKPFLYKTVMRNYWDHTPNRIPGHQDNERIALSLKFTAAMTKEDEFDYVNLFDFFCNSDGCLTYLGDNRREGLITFDDAHLRPFASVYLAENLLKPLILKNVGDASN
jgi:peptidoglycan/LPS O-acetylase OafA/YrhL